MAVGRISTRHTKARTIARIASTWETKISRPTCSTVRILKMLQMNGSRFILTLVLLSVTVYVAQSIAQDKILVEGKGFGTLVIGNSKVDDVIQFLGKPDSIEQTKAEYSRNYIYSKVGLTFNFHDDTLNTISTLPHFDGKTSRGITLTSSLQDIEAVYGSPLLAPGKTKDNAKTWAYDGVIFWLKRSGIFNRFDGIDKIVIYDKSFRRSSQ